MTASPPPRARSPHRRPSSVARGCRCPTRRRPGRAEAPRLAAASRYRRRSLRTQHQPAPPCANRRRAQAASGAAVISSAARSASSRPTDRIDDADLLLSRSPPLDDAPRRSAPALARPRPGAVLEALLAQSWRSSSPSPPIELGLNIDAISESDDGVHRGRAAPLLGAPPRAQAAGGAHGDLRVALRGHRRLGALAVECLDKQWSVLALAVAPSLSHADTVEAGVDAASLMTLPRVRRGAPRPPRHRGARVEPRVHRLARPPVGVEGAGGTAWFVSARRCRRPTGACSTSEAAAPFDVEEVVPSSHLEGVPVDEADGWAPRSAATRAPPSRASATRARATPSEDGSIDTCAWPGPHCSRYRPVDPRGAISELSTHGFLDADAKDVTVLVQVQRAMPSSPRRRRASVQVGIATLGAGLGTLPVPAPSSPRKLGQPRSFPTRRGAGGAATQVVAHASRPSHPTSRRRRPPVTRVARLSLRRSCRCRRRAARRRSAAQCRRRAARHAARRAARRGALRAAARPPRCASRRRPAARPQYERTARWRLERLLGGGGGGGGGGSRNHRRAHLWDRRRRRRRRRQQRRRRRRQQR